MPRRVQRWLSSVSLQPRSPRHEWQCAAIDRVTDSGSRTSSLSRRAAHKLYQSRCTSWYFHSSQHGGKEQKRGLGLLASSFGWSCREGSRQTATETLTYTISCYRETIIEARERILKLAFTSSIAKQHGDCLPSQQAHVRPHPRIRGFSLPLTCLQATRVGSDNFVVKPVNLAAAQNPPTLIQPMPISTLLSIRISGSH